MNWDEWRGSFDGRPQMLIKHFVSALGCRVDLHKFVRADDPDCFHTHPAYALRIILWGGYEEQVYVGTTALTYYRAWRPGSIGLVKPSYCHRTSKIMNGIASYSLWLRGPKRFDVQLRGKGWPKPS